MVRTSSLAALLTFLTFFGAGLLMVVSFLVVGGLGSMIPFADGFSIVLSLIVLLPLTKRLLISIGVSEGDARKLALLVGLLSVLVFYMTIPRACGWCR
ncbi:hypothetical protein [Thermococcus radiotolerans]|uniref:Uncharacterized protein n=1 Tax=Thermococcus radiotolerans TaxID=187880 RepID=A0A2Z2NAP9_9EURY|nr:hypothetical protein [Thermococcus radiotolerans]ASJ14919.1 hypothetical protein A3L10_07140 [Thermococcus radiotolerans]